MELVERAIAAINERKIDAYLACCAEDVQLQTPLMAIEGVYEGLDAIRRFFNDISATVADFRIIIERLEPVGADRVLAFTSVVASGRVSGISADTATANVYDLAGGKIKRIRIFLDRQDAIEAARLRE